MAILARTLVVVTGAMNCNTFWTAAAPASPKRESSEAGSSDSCTGVEKKAFASVQNALSAKTACHHPSHRRTVRLGAPCTPATVAHSPQGFARPAALATTTITEMYTLRPKKRSDGGVARRRQPSRRQHKLSRHV